MNKSECDRLAYHLANMSFGVNATQHSARSANSIITDFPQVQDDFNRYKEVFAAQRIAQMLKAFWVKDFSEGSSSTLRSKVLAIKHETIEDLLEVWGETVDRQLSSIVNQYESLSRIVKDPAWKRLVRESQKMNLLTEEEAALMA